MFRRVKAEAVDSAVNAFLEQTEHALLDMAVGGVEVGHADVAVSHGVACAVRGGIGLGVVVVGVLHIALNVGAEVLVAAALLLVRHVVRYDVDDDLDVVVVRFLAHSLQLRLSAQP